MNETHYPLLYPVRDRLLQYGSTALAAVMALTVPAQVILTLMGAPGGLFIMTAIITAIMTPIALMPTAQYPAVTLRADGITLHTVVWGQHFVAWDAVSAFKVYPLLPTEGQEANRRRFVGRKHYRPAEGVMLVIPSLPLPYATAAFFAGEAGKRIIALTNRSHANYDQLKRQLIAQLGEPEPFQ